MLTDEGLDEFAQECAAAYCRRYHARRQFDDAYGYAALFLISKRESWKTHTKRELKRLCVFNLIDVYRSASKNRNKHQLVRADKRVDGLVYDRDHVKEYDEREEARRLVAVAALNAGVADCLPLLFELADGKTQREAAYERGCSLRTINRIYALFKRELLKLGKERGVVIVEPEDDVSDLPLFRNAKENENN